MTWQAMKRYQLYQCEDFLLDEEFIFWVDNALDFKNSKWEAILENYPEKAREFYEAIEIRNAFKNQANIINDDFVEVEIEKIIFNTKQSEKKIKPLRLVWWAASFFTIALGGILFWLYQSDKLESENRMVQYENKGVQKMEVQLPDSSIAILDPKGLIRLSENWERSLERVVVISGNVFFTVKRKEEQPFIVHTNNAQIKVLGTSFRVSEERNSNRITVRTGKVQVSTLKESNIVTLTANQEVIVQEKNNTLQKYLLADPVLIDETVSFNFENTPFIDVLETFKKGYGIEFEYDIQKAKQYHVTIPFKEDSFRKKMEILCKTVGATYEVVDGVVKMKFKY